MKSCELRFNATASWHTTANDVPPHMTSVSAIAISRHHWRQPGGNEVQRSSPLSLSRQWRALGRAPGVRPVISLVCLFISTSLKP
ncbi:hypothetical protein SKAU_G00258000 [Synaphobranchus kaupii]|uniref:Uncharacterized protein n=1 Tax=Synaphobranchus kaupii TaxID=118154 RepID=A0A9Q1F460_SYNKA|nr:hypothetical protein SKAU_G00258000 [Synaphobranchus kaupii]